MMPRYYVKVGYATRSGFYRTHAMEVEASAISEAAKLAADLVRGDRRRQVRDAKDVEVVLKMGMVCLTPGCTEDPNDGEGFDGYCGNCADRQEEQMGYTHYWQQTRDFDETTMGDIAGAIRRIIKTATGRKIGNGYTPTGPVPLKICGGDGTGEPILSKEKIAFNGKGPDMDHETFYLEPKRELPYEGARPDQLGWAFCKTARKPYDVVVTACLTLLQADYGFEVSSDGDVEDWEAGVKLAEEALGRSFANPMIVEQLIA